MREGRKSVYALFFVLPVETHWGPRYSKILDLTWRFKFAMLYVRAQKEALRSSQPHTLFLLLSCSTKRDFEKL
ncbi:hypothetical protein BDN70DRAFT_880145, partial [Pholiota conissans]